MTDGLKMIVFLLTIVLMIGSAIWWEIYKFQDCKKVGHSTLYCLFSSGK